MEDFPSLESAPCVTTACSLLLVSDSIAFGTAHSRRTLDAAVLSLNSLVRSSSGLRSFTKEFALGAAPSGVIFCGFSIGFSAGFGAVSTASTPVSLSPSSGKLKLISAASWAAPVPAIPRKERPIPEISIVVIPTDTINGFK